MIECECTVPGWCERHQCQKTAHWHSLCQTREDYFQLWEEGCGPGQQQPTRRTREQRRIACVHRGGLSRQVSCPSCKGEVRIKVFACQLYHECTVGRRVENIACCAVCDEYEPIEMNEPGNLKG